MNSIEKVSIDEVRLSPTNPRIIKDEKFKKLVKSIQEFPQMLEIRPIVIDEEGYVLGGNMRYKACLEAGLKEVYIIRADNLTEQQKKEFTIKDNASFGDWDWEVLQNSWDMTSISEWGIDVFELPNEIDYTLLDGDDEDDEDINNRVKDKQNNSTKSVLLPFRKEKDMSDFVKIMKQWQFDGIDPGHFILELVLFHVKLNDSK
jgi:hypothetical protein